VNRRLAFVLVVLIVPGGLLALMGAAVIKALAQSTTGRKAWGRVTALWRRPTPPFETVQRAA
jgi:hypothetical protein